MRVLIACEESQAVTIRMRAKGHEAYSADIQPCSGGHPEWHLQQDVTELLKQHWDMIIAFPPCTYMSNAGACRMYPTKGNIDQARLEKGLAAKEFFMQFYNSNCKKVCIENPKPLNVIGLPKETQTIQPWMFGHAHTKKTLLWLKGLPPLVPTNVITEGITPFLPSGTGRKLGGASYGVVDRTSKSRSKTFAGIADAMADQWCGDVKNVFLFSSYKQMELELAA